MTWGTPELDEAAAHALSVLTLYTSGQADDAALASRLLDDFTQSPQGVADIVRGLVSVSATLLVILEFEAGISPPEGLREAGRLVASAAYAQKPR
jgi:hypothetical protein